MRRRSFTGLMSAALVPAAWPAFGQGSYPDRPIRLVVPYPAGGVTDVIARVLADEVGKSLGQRVLVDNKPGAAGNVGSDMVAKSKPDGYTLLLALIGNTISMSLYKDVRYDFQRDFAPILQLTSSSNVLVVHPSVPVKSAKELIDFVRERPGKLNYASTGNGTSTHLSGELFKLATGLNITHVPYRGGAPAQNDLIAGQVQMMFDNTSVSTPRIKDGALRALATTGRVRNKALPDLPTIVEVGYPDVVVEGWSGLVAPAGTPKEIVARLNEEFNKALQTPQARKMLEDTGSTLVGGTDEASAELIDIETKKWARVVKEANIRVD